MASITFTVLHAYTQTQAQSACCPLGLLARGLGYCISFDVITEDAYLYPSGSSRCGATPSLLSASSCFITRRF
ncbi:hypothetical protein LX36DRAFT_660532 [Colletotrichum falcatum]|nr:hypothetical protein LX36DRAFT_660532 [Colletotrichum falcatum]